MKAGAANRLVWTARGAMVIGLLWLAMTDATALLSRNALVLFPLAGLVALLCICIPCRPVTRHTLWLALLVWLMAGAVLPPLTMNDDADATGLASNAGVNDSSGEYPGALEAGSPRPSVEKPVRSIIRSFKTSPIDFSPVGILPEEVAFELSEPDFEPEEESPAAPYSSGRSALCDVDVVACDEVEIIGGKPADTVPTPPLTVARTESPPPSDLPPAGDLGGQLSLLSNTLSSWTPRSNEPPGFLTTLQPGNPPIVGLTRIQARRANLRPDVAPEEESAGIEADSHSEASGVSSWWSDTTDIIVAFVTERIKPWAGAFAALRDAAGLIPPIPSAFWLSGVGVMIALRLHRARRFRAVVRRGRFAPKSIRREVQAAAHSLGLTQAPDVIVVKDRLSPMIWFDGQPTLVLPLRLWRELDSDGRLAVLYHELAHLRRRDHWVCRIESLIGMIYWWHPVVWWIRGRLREEAEHCCDAWVTWLQPDGRRAYAEALIRTKEFVSRPTSPVPAGAIGMTSGRARRFARRLTMVMTQRVTPTTSRASLALAASVLAIGWLATPARSCDPKKNGKEANAYVSTTPAPPAMPVVAPVTPVPPVAATAPQVVSVPSPSIPAALAPIAAMSMGDEHSAPRARGQGDDAMEERIARLEQQLARLTELLEARGGAVARTPRPGGIGSTSPGTPSMVLVEPTPVPPMAEVHRRSGQAAWAPTYTRDYKIPKGRLDGVWELMALPDVPPRVRSIEGGIQLEGTHEQHLAFGAFIDLITSDAGEQVQAYRLPDHKLKALSELMVRSDVPILVEPGENEIRVHGNAAVQNVFRSFINLIHPRQMTAGEKVGSAAEARAKDDLTIATKSRKEAAEEVEAAVAAEMAAEQRRGRAEGQIRRRMDFESLRKAAAELEAQAAQLEAQADRLSDEADALNDRATEILEDSDGGDGVQHEARALEAKARELERAAKKLYEKSAKLEQKSEEMTEKAEQAELDAEAEMESAR